MIKDDPRVSSLRIQIGDRIVFRVKKLGVKWVVTRSDERHLSAVEYSQKKDAVAITRTVARRLWKKHGQPTQLVIHGKNGKIQTEYTYGKDPERRKG